MQKSDKDHAKEALKLTFFIILATIALPTFIVGLFLLETCFLVGVFEISLATAQTASFYTLIGIGIFGIMYIVSYFMIGFYGDY